MATFRSVWRTIGRSFVTVSNGLTSQIGGKNFSDAETVGRENDSGMAVGAGTKEQAHSGAPGCSAGASSQHDDGAAGTFECSQQQGVAEPPEPSQCTAKA